MFPRTLSILLCLFSLQAVSQDRYELNTGWQYAPVATTKARGTDLSLPSYDLSGWKPAVVPGTVLTNMLYHQQVPDPFMA